MATRGFSLVELMVTVAIVGVLASTAIPAFMKYTRKAKTSEARQNVRKVYDGARQYYLDQHSASVNDMQPLPFQFPLGSADLPTISGLCCVYGPLTSPAKCPPDYDNDVVWKALAFGMDEPHYYRYRYASPFPTSYFNAVAFGDLDCDGTQSRFSMYGFVDPTYADGPIGTGLMTRLSELE